MRLRMWLRSSFFLFLISEFALVPLDSFNIRLVGVTICFAYRFFSKAPTNQRLKRESPLFHSFFFLHSSPGCLVEQGIHLSQVTITLLGLNDVLYEAK